MGRLRTLPAYLEDPEDPGELLDFSAYNPTAHQMIRRSGSDFELKPGLNFRRERRTIPLLRSKTKRGLRYVSQFHKIQTEIVEPFNQDHSSDTSSWDSDTIVGGIFTGLFVNMTFVSQPSDEEEDIMLYSEDDPWIKHLNDLRKI